jgi:hypothetical protein
MAGPNEFLTDLDTSKLFDDAELSGASKERLLSSAEVIKNKLLVRRKVLDNMVARIVPSLDWSIAYGYLKEIEPTWTANVAELQATLQGDDREAILHALRRLALILLNFEVQIGPSLMNAEHGLHTQAAADYAADLVLNRLRADLDRTFAEVKAISERTADTKKALDATSSFREHVGKIRQSSQRQEAFSYVAMFAVLSSLASLEIIVPRVLQLTGADALAVRIALGALAVFWAFFFYNQYKIAAAMKIKYDHLSGLLNGGAVDLIALLKDHDDFRKRILERMADAFMDTNDITNAIQKTKTPTEDVIQLARSLIESKKA